MNNQANDIPAGFKMTELGMLPEAWKAARLVEITPKKKFAIVDGPFGSQMKVSEFTSTGVPVVEMEQLKDNNFKANFRRFISEQKYDEVKRSTVIAGDLIISKTGTLGLVGIVPPTVAKAVMTSRLAKVSIDGKLAYTKFVYYALLFIREIGFWDSVGEGTTIKVLTIRKIGSSLIPLPPLSEQKAIVGVLSIIQKAIEAQDKIIAAAREMKRSLMRHLFTYGPVPVAEAENVPLKETEIGMVPEEWEATELGNIMSTVYRYPSYYGIQYVDIGVPEVRGELLKATGEIDSDFAKLRFISPETAERFPRTKLVDGDIVLSVRGTMGKVGLVRQSLNGANITANLIRMSPKRDMVDSDFLKFVLLYEEFHLLLDSLSPQTTIKTITAPTLKSIPIRLPPIHEQKVIARMLSSVDKKIEVEEKLKAALKALFKTILHQLMTGKVRAKDLEVTPV